MGAGRSANFANTGTIGSVDTLLGGTGNNTITLSSPLTTAMTVDLGTGSNKLTLANGGNTGTISDVATIIGGTGPDVITLGGPANSASISLGVGTDSLTFGNFANTATVAVGGTLVGGSGADSITLTAAPHHQAWHGRSRRRQQPADAGERRQRPARSAAIDTPSSAATPTTPSRWRPRRAMPASTSAPARMRSRSAISATR